MRASLSVFSAILVIACLTGRADGQTASSLGRPRARIAGPVEDGRRVTFAGNVHALAKSSPSQAVDPSTPMEHMILFLNADAAQESQLDQLIAQQQDPKSPLYHHFLTPQDFGSHFGVAQTDIDKVTSWLLSQGFTVNEQPAGKRAIVFSGTSGQVAAAFKTEIRRYDAAGASHYANSSDPQAPAALSGVVGGIVKLHDFRHMRSIAKQTPLTAAQLANPEFTYGSNHYLSPADYATIYDINPLYSAGINGAGQTIAIIARSNISVSDVQSFRGRFGLVAKDPQIVIVNNDPGVVPGDSTETTLDTEWSGGVAPNATVKVVVAASTNSADGIDLSALYVVNNNVAPVVSLSYGSCEAGMGSSELAFYNSLWQQAAAQGMTVMVSSGDSGAAGCYGGNSSSGSGQAINGLCSSPYATCVGGTQFSEGANPGQYWLPGNNAAYGSAVSYIPEGVWNESGSNGGSGLWAAGGGASIAYPKPSWQSGPGVPADGHRDVPDVSLTAAGHDAYIVVQGGSMMSISGTSASAPSFAGLMALVNQKTNARQGLANTIFYPLAVNQAAGGAAIFHDTVSGNNSVPGVVGFAAAAGYDRASGLGSVDAAMMVNHWTDASKATLSLSSTSATLTVKTGQTVQTTITSTASVSLKSAVTLAVAGTPTGMTATLGATTIASPGSGSVALTVVAGSAVKPGTYALTVTGQGGGQTATLVLSVVVPTPTFTLATNVATLSISVGSTGQVAVSTTPQNGFASSLALTVSGVPAGVTAAFSPSIVSGAAVASSTLTLTVAKTVTGGSYPLTITAVGGGVTQTSSVTLVVVVPASCTLAANPSTVMLTAGESSSVQVSCGSVQGTFSGPLALSVTGMPTGVTTTGSSLTAGSTGTLNIGSITATAGGTYTLSLTATGSGFSKTVAIPLKITVPSTFKMTAAQSVLSVKAGAAAQVSIGSTHFGTFNSAVNMNATGLPSGVTAAFTKTSFAAPGDGTTVVTFTVSANTKAGTYPVSVTGTGGGITQTAVVSLTVATGQNFTFSVNTNAMTIQKGGAAGTVIVSTGNFTGGFNSTITITFGGLAPGMNYGATGATTGNNLVNVSIGITAASYTPVGTFPITIYATGAGISYSAVVQVTVTQPTGSTKH